MTTKPRLLIVSFSPIAGDARVLKQVRHFVKDYCVSTCGYGEAPEGVEGHIRIPDEIRANDLYGRYVTLHWYRLVYGRIGAVRWARKNLRVGEWDVVLANDVETVPLALRLKPLKGVHADLHEYSPRLHEEIPAWKKRIKPFYDWLCRRYVSRASSWTTVSAGLAREYESQFGFRPDVVTNAAPYAELEPGVVNVPIRLVHSGACLRNRNLIALVEGVAAAESDVTLDLYLTANDPGYLEELRERAALTDRVLVKAPVPYDSLVTTLNDYDIGIHVLPPVNFNNEWALPNKLFDYVQARLGILVGPSAEMSRYVRTYGLGLVTEDFTAEALSGAIDLLSANDVTRFKTAADDSAHILSAESQIEVWDRAVSALAQRVDLGAG